MTTVAIVATNNGVDAVGHAISWAIARSFLCRQLPQVRHHCRLICWRQPNARLLRVSFSCSRPVRTLKQYAHIVIVAMAAAIAIRSHRNCGDGCSDRTANWALSGQCVVDAAQDLDGAHSDQWGIYARLLRVSFSCSQPVRTLKPQYAHIVIVTPSHRSQ